MAKKITFYSSVGAALFPHITEKDMEGKYASKKFSTQLVYQTPEDFAKDKAKLQAIADSFTFEHGEPKLPFKTDKSGEQSLVAKSQYLPMIYDAKKAIIVDKWSPPSDEELKAKRIRQGSIIRISGNIFTYDTRSLGAGISLQLDSVQLIKTADGGADGFDVEDGDAYEVAEADGFSERDLSDEIPF